MGAWQKHQKSTGSGSISGILHYFKPDGNPSNTRGSRVFQGELFTNGYFDPADPQLPDLMHRGVSTEFAPVSAIEGEPGSPVVVLADGRRMPMDGLFVATKTRIVTPLPQMLGCAIEEGPQGPFVATDGMKATTVPGVFACGDVASPMASVAISVGHGALAGAAVHRSIIFPQTVAKAA
jgi:thioredoxin reductase